MTKLLQSMGILKPEEPREIKPPVKGPHSAGLGNEIPDAAFVARNATPEDLAALRRKIEARKRAVLPPRYWKCSNPKCGFAGAYPGDINDPGNCLRSNWAGRNDDHMVEMTPAEKEAHLAREKAIANRWLKDAPRRMKELAQFNKRHFQDRFEPFHGQGR